MTGLTWKGAVRDGAGLGNIDLQIYVKDPVQEAGCWMISCLWLGSAL